MECPSFPTARMVKFRLYTSRPGTSLYLLVRIFPTQREMRAKLDGESYPLPRLPPRARGVMATQQMLTRVKGRFRCGPCIGTVNFCLPFLTVETVTHEFLHALFAWADRKRLRPQARPRNEEVEEVLCYALGRFVRRFLVQAARLGLHVGQSAAFVPRRLHAKLQWRRVRTDQTPLDEYAERPLGLPPRRQAGPRLRHNQRWSPGPKLNPTRAGTFSRGAIHHRA